MATHCSHPAKNLSILPDRLLTFPPPVGLDKTSLLIIVVIFLLALNLELIGHRSLFATLVIFVDSIQNAGGSCSA